MALSQSIRGGKLDVRNKALVRGMFIVAMVATAVMTSSVQASAANFNIWAGDQITVTFTLPPLTNLLWTPALGNSGATVSEIANIGEGFTTNLGTIPVDLVKSSTNTFVARFTVPEPQYGTLYADVTFNLNLPIKNNPANGFASGGSSSDTYTYVTPPPVGQTPEVPYAAALPVIGLLLSYGVIRWRKAERSPLS
jgi:hypothetical protein